MSFMIIFDWYTDYLWCSFLLFLVYQSNMMLEWCIFLLLSFRVQPWVNYNPKKLDLCGYYLSKNDLKACINSIHECSFWFLFYYMATNHDMSLWTCSQCMTYVWFRVLELLPYLASYVYHVLRLAWWWYVMVCDLVINYWLLTHWN